MYFFGRFSLTLCYCQNHWYILYCSPISPQISSFLNWHSGPTYSSEHPHMYPFLLECDSRQDESCWQGDSSEVDPHILHCTMPILLSTNGDDPKSILSSPMISWLMQPEHKIGNFNVGHKYQTKQ